MVIGAHIIGDNAEESLLLFALKKATVLQPQLKFILFTNATLKDLPQCFVQINISPKPKNKLLLFYWYKYKLPKLLFKYNVTSFISNAGMLATDLPLNQYIFIENRNLFLQQKGFLKNNFADAIATAKTVFVTDSLLGNEYKKIFGTNKLKQICFNRNELNLSFTFEETEATKEKYTSGFDYYLFPVNAILKPHIVTVLKAFSQLKKWQKTSLKLMLLFENEIDEKLLPDFKNYKYKNDVVSVKETVQNSLSLTAASFALIFLGDYSYKQNVYDALQYNIPVIAADTNDNRILFNQAVAYASLTTEGLAQQLQIMYKDEIFKKQQIQHANQFLTDFDNQKNAQMFLEIISN